MIVDYLSNESNFHIFFVESLCEDQAIIEENIRVCLFLQSINQIFVYWQCKASFAMETLCS